MYLNSKLYNRFKAIDLKQRRRQKINSVLLQEFELAGANLSDNAKK
jgi:Zn-dependent oligopeptidase